MDVMCVCNCVTQGHMCSSVCFTCTHVCIINPRGVAVPLQLNTMHLAASHGATPHTVCASHLLVLCRSSLPVLQAQP